MQRAHKREGETSFRQSVLRKKKRDDFEIDFSLFKKAHTNSRTTSQNNATKTQGAAMIEESVTQEDIEEKKEMAGWLLFGDGVEKDDEKAVSLLGECGSW